MPYSQPIRPEDDTIVLQLRDPAGQVTSEITNFREYNFQSHFLTPTDHFSFTIGDEETTRSLRDGIHVGQKVTLQISGYVQAGGYIDRMPVKTSRRTGTEMRIEGRDWLSPAVDAHMDPEKVKFKPGMSLRDVLIACFAPWWDNLHISDLSDDGEEANANVITGQIRGPKTTKKGKPLKSFQLHQLKPYPQEGVFQFAARVAQRFGLWIWASADGFNLIVGKPDFDQRPIYDIFHKVGTDTVNYEEGENDPNATDQPSIIIATGFGGGGEYSRSGMKVIMVNEFTGLNASGAIRPELNAIIDDNPEASFVQSNAEVGASFRMPDAPVRAIYLHDDESKTPEQLEFFVRREMALRQQHAYGTRFLFEGHTLRGVPFYTNSIANVDDDKLQIHDRMWCMSRTFMKSRGGGTLAHTDWIVPGTVDFGGD